jgi:hypothetical protein
MVYRDDDVNIYTDLYILTQVQKLFDKYNKVHTITVIMRDLWDSRGVWQWLMTTKNINVELHGWEHIDYTSVNYETIYNSLKLALMYWGINGRRCEEQYKYKLRPITTFYPPWNKVNEDVYKACSDLGLVVDNRPTGQDVYSFHWWEMVEAEQLSRLEGALRDSPK